MIKNILTVTRKLSQQNYFFIWNNIKLCQSSLFYFQRNYHSLNNEEFFKKFFCIGKEVQNALFEGKPIVALESALITNGLEYPINLKVALKLQEIIRNNGAVPATITILDGKIRVGIENKELERIAEPNNQKCSLRDLANFLVQKKIGGTTVAATMWIAHQAGIKVFSTGGIGGVHKGGEKSLDISADLVELGRCPIAIVCAGVKSILDIGRTLEFLETQGVNVLVFDKKPNFPGFFIPQTEFLAPHCTDSIEEISDIIVCSQQLGLQKGILIACPIPVEDKSKSELVQHSINQALNEANSKNIFGNKVTPFVLKRVAELSEGESLRLNISLLENNARIAAQLANLYTNKIINTPTTMEDDKSIFVTSQIKNTKNEKPLVFCIGASIVDLEVLQKENSKNSPKVDISSYLPSNIVQRAGGVARNHAEALARLGIDVLLFSAFGTDLNGRNDFGANFLLEKLEGLKNLDFSHSLFCKYLGTATSISISKSSKGIIQGFISADELLSKINSEYIDKISNLFKSADFLLIDANLTSEAIKRINYWANKTNTKIWLEPTNSLKISKIFDALGDWPLTKIDVFSPNLGELRSFSENFSQRVGKSEAKECKEFIKNIEEHLLNSTIDSNFHQKISNIKLPQAFQPKQHLLITCDRFGVLLFSRSNNNEFKIEYSDAPKICSEKLISVSGAGDCFNSGFLFGILNNLNLKECLEFGRKCAELSLISIDTVPETINKDIFKV